MANKTDLELLQDAQEQIATLNTDLEASQSLATEAGERATAAEAQVTALTTERDSLTEQVKTLTTERDSLAEQVKTLTSERDSLTAQVTTITGERDTALANVATEQTHNREMREHAARNGVQLPGKKTGAEDFTGEKDKTEGLTGIAKARAYFESRQPKATA